MDEASKKKLKRIEARFEEQESDEMVDIDHEAVRKVDSGDELSETEMRIQDEQNEFHKLHKEIMGHGGVENLYSRFTDLKQK